MTEIIEKDGECKKKKEDSALSKEYWRFIYEQALNDANESENEEELLTMEGISPNSFFLPQASTNIAEQISRITCNYCPLFGRPFREPKCSPVRSLLWWNWHIGWRNSRHNQSLSRFRDGGILSALHGFMAKWNESGAAHDLEDGISLQKQYRMERVEL
jgi:hypothetical protein